jgi:hypothetical protein
LLPQRQQVITNVLDFPKELWNLFTLWKSYQLSKGMTKYKLHKPAVWTRDHSLTLSNMTKLLTAWFTSSRGANQYLNTFVKLTKTCLSDGPKSDHQCFRPTEGSLKPIQALMKLPNSLASGRENSVTNSVQPCSCQSAWQNINYVIQLFGSYTILYLCLIRPSRQLLDSLLQEVCIRFVYIMFWSGSEIQTGYSSIPLHKWSFEVWSCLSNQIFLKPMGNRKDQNLIKCPLLRLLTCPHAHVLYKLEF